MCRPLPSAFSIENVRVRMRMNDTLFPHMRAHILLQYERLPCPPNKCMFAFYYMFVEFLAVAVLSLSRSRSVRCLVLLSHSFIIPGGHKCSRNTAK